MSRQILREVETGQAAAGADGHSHPPNQKNTPAASPTGRDCDAGANRLQPRPDSPGVRFAPRVAQVLALSFVWNFDWMDGGESGFAANEIAHSANTENRRVQ